MPDSWPEHARHIPPGRIASAPYNFVPLPKTVIPAVDDPKDLPDHDRYGSEAQNDTYRYTGHFEVALETKSPLYIRGPHTLAEFARAEGQSKDTPYHEHLKNKPAFFHTASSEEDAKGWDEEGVAIPATDRPLVPVIPGSSLRGMLRTALEIISFGKLERMNQKKMFFRAIYEPSERDEDANPLLEVYQEAMGRFNRNVRSGYLLYEENRWSIQPAMRDIDGKGDPLVWSALPVKEDEIPTGAIPGFRRFDDGDYRPDYFSVTYEPALEEIPNTNRDRWVVDEIGSETAGYWYQGTLVCSGNMLETGDGAATSPRSTHIVVPERNPNTKPLSIRPQAVQDYIDALTPFLKDPEKGFHPERGCLQEGRPVFYIEERDGTVLHFGHSPNFRIAALLPGEARAATPRDLVPEALQREAQIDFADALFGYVKSPNVPYAARSYASRVSITEARFVGTEETPWLVERDIVPKILASPKPSCFPHYLVQDTGIKRDLNHYASSTVIRGHKRYWHQGNHTAADLAEPADAEPGTQHTRIKPLRSGVQFCFRVYFENLSDHELGALCWTLHPQGEAEQSYYHQLGMGKPLGMGAVALRATLYLTDRKKRYQLLFAGNDWTTQTRSCAAEDAEPFDTYLAAFEQYVLHHLHSQPDAPRDVGEAQHLRELPRIKALLKMMRWPGYRGYTTYPPYLSELKCPNTRYMELDEYAERGVLPHPLSFPDREEEPALKEVVTAPPPSRRSASIQRSAPRTPSSARQQGTVTSFSPQSGGLIAPDQGGDPVPVHMSNLDDLRSLGILRTGQKVTFELGKDEEGQLQAIRVRRV